MINVCQKENLPYAKNLLGAIYSYIHKNKIATVLAFMWLFIASKYVFLLIVPNCVPWISGEQV